MRSSHPRIRLRAIGALLALLLVPAVPHAAQAPMPDDASVVFLHHSTGGVIWAGGVPEWIADYDAAHATSYTITESAYPSGSYPWDNYPYDYWNLWVNHAGSTWLGQPSLETLAANHDVIVFKHCFPVSSIGADIGVPDVTSAAKTLENYRAQYAALKARLRAFPNQRFIVWTGAALRQQDTTPEQAQRAKQFFDWVRTTWDEPGDNIYVWDFFGLETDGGLYLAPDHASGDSHPSATFAAAVAPLFAQRVVDVIRGLGDSTGTADSTPALVSRATLRMASANPCAGAMRFRLSLPAPAAVTLAVYDVGGREVARLADQPLPAGEREFAWDAPTADAGAGVYFVRMRAGADHAERRIVRLR